MTITQPTSDQPEPTPRTVRTAAAAVVRFLDEFPQFEAAPIHWYPGDGLVRLTVKMCHPDSEKLVNQIAVCLGAPVRSVYTRASGTGDWYRVVSVERYPGVEYAGARWEVDGYLDATAYEAFAATHDPDPQNWSIREREQFAALSAGGVLAVAS